MSNLSIYIQYYCWTLSNTLILHVTNKRTLWKHIVVWKLIYNKSNTALHSILFELQISLLFFLFGVIWFVKVSKRFPASFVVLCGCCGSMENTVSYLIYCLFLTVQDWLPTMGSHREDLGKVLAVDFILALIWDPTRPSQYQDNLEAVPVIAPPHEIQQSVVAINCSSPASDNYQVVSLKNSDEMKLSSRGYLFSWIRNSRNLFQFSCERTSTNSNED